MIDDSSYKKAKDFLDFLILCYYRTINSKSKQKLLNFLFLKNLTQADLDNFLSDWDIEATGASLSLFLAYFMKAHPELEYPSYVKPRLEGLINYNRFKKVKLFENFSKITQKLNKNNIIPLVIGDIAVKCINQNADTRNINLIIRCKDFKSVKTLIKQNYDEVVAEKNHIKIHLEDNLFINIFAKYDFDTKSKYAKNYLKYLFAESKRTKLYDTEVLLPSDEDIVFIELIEIAKIIKFNTGFENLLQSLTNIVYLKENYEINLQKITDTAKMTQTGVQLKIASRFIDEIIPDFIHDELKDDNLFKKEITEYLYLSRFRNDCREYFKAQIPLKNQIAGIFSQLKEIFVSILNIFYYVYFRYIFVKIMRSNSYLLRQYYKFKDKNQ